MPFPRLTFSLVVRSYLPIPFVSLPLRFLVYLYDRYFFLSCLYYRNYSKLCDLYRFLFSVTRISLQLSLNVLVRFSFSKFFRVIYILNILLMFSTLCITFMIFLFFFFFLLFFINSLITDS